MNGFEIILNFTNSRERERELKTFFFINLDEIDIEAFIQRTLSN